MSPAAWTACVVVLASALAAGLGLGLRARRAGTLRAAALFDAPATWLFVLYLVAAGLMVPTSEAETTSPLVGLAVAVPLWVVLAGAASLGTPRRLAIRASLALLFASAMLCSGAVVLALASPRWIPSALR